MISSSRLPSLVYVDAWNVARDVGEVHNRVRYELQVTTVSDCGILTSGVLILVATDVLFA
jgi:hypothetical protein